MSGGFGRRENVISLICGRQSAEIYPLTVEKCTPKVAFARYDLPHIDEMGVSIFRNLSHISEMGSWAHTFRHFQGVAE